MQASPLGKILVVDDSPLNLAAFSALLEPLGARVVCASSAAEAIPLATGPDLALILMDVRMPEVDGYEAARLLREREGSRDVPLIFVTAAEEEGLHAFRGYSAGAVDFIVKPVDPLILRRKASVFLALHKKSRDVRERAERMLEETRARDAVLGKLCHDFRTPLNAIVGWAHLIRKGELDPSQVERALASIHRNARALTHLVQELGDVAGASPSSGAAESASELTPSSSTWRSEASQPPPSKETGNGNGNGNGNGERDSDADPRPMLTGIHALVVEDDPDGSDLIEAVLRGFGATVTTAGTAREAWSALAQRAPDIIVSDLGLPDEDGFSLMRRIRRHALLSDLPAIALSAYTSRRDVNEALAAGFQAHLAKPIEPRLLGDTIARVSRRDMVQ
ncbi:MAG: response regulator [Myxococcota bacterium]